MNQKTIGFAAFLASAIAVPAIGLAQPESGFYLGASVGQAKVKDFCTDLAGFVGSCDDKDTAWKIIGGYQFNRNLGVEAGYTDLGRASLNGTVLGVPVSARAKAKGFELLGVGTLPLNEQFALYAKAGLFRWDVDTSVTAAGITAAIGDKGTDFTFGVGVKYNLTRNAAVRFEFQRYNDVGNDATTGQSNVNVWSLGLQFRF
jgi:OOP family OmpA-OmpF porin